MRRHGDTARSQSGESPPHGIHLEANDGVLPARDVNVTIGKVNTKTEATRVNDEELARLLLRYLKAELVYPERPLAAEIGRSQSHK